VNATGIFIRGKHISNIHLSLSYATKFQPLLKQTNVYQNLILIKEFLNCVDERDFTLLPLL